MSAFHPFRTPALISESDPLRTLGERDGIGWKMDVIGHKHNEWPHGDTYQDTLDELMPFLAAYADHNSTWADFDTGEEMTFWGAIASVTGSLY